eukprot:m51a1_g12907 putative bisphosphate nucleotidase (67) ;mRNA; f:880-1588
MVLASRHPLDATKEYTLGKADPVMTLIGVAYNGHPIAGVLHQPFVGELGRRRGEAASEEHLNKGKK